MVGRILLYLSALFTYIFNFFVFAQIDGAVTKPVCFSGLSENSSAAQSEFLGGWKKQDIFSQRKDCLNIRGASRSCPKLGKGGSTFRMVYEPSRCTLPDFDARIFTTALRGRKLYLVGDSVMMQQKIRLLCDLYSGNYNNSIFSIRISHLGHLKKNMKRLEKIPADAIIIMNVGLHYNLATEYKIFLSKLEDSCFRNNCTAGQIVWQETAAQHFPDTKSGYFSKRKSCPRGCAKFKRSQLLNYDFRNKLANEVMQKNGIFVVPIWEVSQAAHDMHVQFNSKTGVCDCTHFCNTPYGIFRVFNAILQSILVSI